MNENAEKVLRFLDELGIRYDMTEHAEVHTIEDCAPIAERLNALIPKNYFLCTRNKKTICLCVVRPEARLNTSSVSAQAGTSRLCFASDDQLEAHLRVKSGAVNPLSLMFDDEHRIQLLIDRELKDAERLAFHPCVNTHSIAMEAKDFFDRFLPTVKHSPVWVDME